MIATWPSTPTIYDGSTGGTRSTFRCGWSEISTDCSTTVPESGGWGQPMYWGDSPKSYVDQYTIELEQLRELIRALRFRNLEWAVEHIEFDKRVLNDRHRVFARVHAARARQAQPPATHRHRPGRRRRWFCGRWRN